RADPEIHDRHAVAEHVVHPAHALWLGRHIEIAVEQVLVVAVARPHHEPMFAERDRLAVGVGRRVADGQDGHGAIIGATSVPPQGAVFSAHMPRNGAGVRTSWASPRTALRSP